MRRGLMGLLAVAATSTVGWAQQTSPALPPPNDQVVQYYRAVMSAGGTQAVIQAISQAVLEAMKQGPMAPAAAQQTLTAMPGAPTAAGAPATTAPKTWADSIMWSGDVRYRDEFRQDHGGNTTDPNANVDYDRIRARLGLDAKLNDNVKAVVRLTTDGYGSDKTGNGGDPQSGNQDLNNGASKKDIFLDLAYIDWNLFGPDNSELHVLAGKMVNPFITFNDDLVWDPDTTPEGLAVKGQYDLSPVTLLGSAGYIILNNQNSATAKYNQTTMYGAQGAVKYQFCPEVAMTMGLSYYGFNNIQGSSVSYVDLMGKAKTKTYYGNDVTVSGGSTNFANGYSVVEPFVSLDMFPTVCDRVVPISVYAQGVDNTAADTLSDGYMCGITLGKAKNPQTAEFGASYAKLERDSTLGMWTDSDRWGGGTDGEGSKLYLKYIILKNLAGQITYYDDKKGIDSGSNGTGYERWAFDLTATF